MQGVGKVSLGALQARRQRRRRPAPAFGRPLRQAPDGPCRGRRRGAKEVPETVLGVPGPFETVEAGRRHPDPMELRIKEVRFGGHGKGSRRYVLCHNQE